ncbi:nodulation protein NodH [Cognatishimia sp. MH4019]|uniref:nodulation protein NodH n=1 Tax=Cognatishimia sp. MH4019 TaxID=2854030 RepID=UPI001CD32414|nr:nodulation protein NodH [Cognatishimia sp. MH4019]
MSQDFDFFVVFAEMRTGSNFLETNINEFPGLACYGEAFNPHFICYPNRTDLFGVTQAMREGDPASLIDAMRKNTDGLPGFRFFHNHDGRVLEHVLPNPRCAKIILTRNPVESYVSWKIAQQTGQWKLADMKHQKSAQIMFDADEFDRHLTALQAFQVQLLNTLQITGQTAFYLAYEDVQDVNVMNGLAGFLGETTQLDSLSKKLKKQNPAPLSEKVKNFDEMQLALGKTDHFDLSRTPNFETRRGPQVPSFLTAAEAPLMYLPVRGGPDRKVKAWMAALDGVKPGALQGNFNQKSLRQWKRQHNGHRSFTVVQHPVERAHVAFCEKILNAGKGSFKEIRNTLRRVYKLPIPVGEVDASWDRRQHREAFLAFIAFLKGNLNNQTGIRVDGFWASQAQCLQGFAQFALPDVTIRADRMENGLAYLASEIGYESPALVEFDNGYPIQLVDIYDDAIEAAVRDVYQRDYMTFGFGSWA